MEIHSFAATHSNILLCLHWAFRFQGLLIRRFLESVITKLVSISMMIIHTPNYVSGIPSNIYILLFQKSAAHQLASEFLENACEFALQPTEA
jgi:hypothetical protein